MTFELYDPQSETSIREGQLPHWFQAGVTYFVTFRTADSVPQKLSRSWHLRREHWLRGVGIDPLNPDWKSQLEELPKLAHDFRKEFVPEFMNWLDRGYGACALARFEVASLVADSFECFDGERYHLGDFVIMPNHVHLLIGLIGTTLIEDQCRSWKRFTATKINEILKRSGRFWQAESFDHLVRSPEQFRYLQRYIADNPKNAGLSSGRYLFRKRVV